MTALNFEYPSLSFLHINFLYCEIRNLGQLSTHDGAGVEIDG